MKISKQEVHLYFFNFLIKKEWREKHLCTITKFKIYAPNMDRIILQHNSWRLAQRHARYIPLVKQIYLWPRFIWEKSCHICARSSKNQKLGEKILSFTFSLAMSLIHISKLHSECKVWRSSPVEHTYIILYHAHCHAALENTGTVISTYLQQSIFA